MNVQIPSLRELPQPTQRAIAFTLGAFALSALVVFLGVLPQQKRIKGLVSETASLNEKLNKMRSDIGTTEATKAKCVAAKGELDKLLAGGVIEPLLGSFAMRGKSLLDQVAQETGFVIDNVKEIPMIPLQLPKAAPEQIYGRQPVEFNGQGTYQQIAAFVAKSEAAQPMITLSSLTIRSQQQSPENHRASIVFEWPAKGEKVKPVEQPSTKKK